MKSRGYDPYGMTLHQLLSFEAAAVDRKNQDRAIAIVDGWAANQPSEHALKHVNELLGENDSDIDTVDFDDLE